MDKILDEHIIKDDVKEILIRFGCNVASKRDENNIKLKELSQITGLSIGAISELESYAKIQEKDIDKIKDKIKIPSLYTIIALSMALDIDVCMFNEVIFPSKKKESITKQKESIIRDNLEQLNVPHKAITSIMTYINILSNIGDMYDLENLKDIPGADKKLERKQKELLNIYSKLRKESY